MPLGSQYRGYGISPPKITYHPDGKVWLTSDLLPNDAKIMEAQKLLDMEGWKGDGISIKNRKVYVRGQGKLLKPFDEIKEIVYIGQALHFFDLPTINIAKTFVGANVAPKGETGVINGDDYTNIVIRFYLVHEKYAPKVASIARDEIFYFKHPNQTLYVVVRTAEEDTRRAKNARIQVSSKSDKPS
jgi:hypothetical protein